MSPEQWIGERGDTRSDIYSLGVVMYQMLSGHTPFDSTASNTLSRQHDIARQHLEFQPVSLRSIRGDVPEHLEAVVVRCMAKSPEDRYQTPGRTRRRSGRHVRADRPKRAAGRLPAARAGRESARPTSSCADKRCSATARAKSPVPYRSCRTIRSDDSYCAHGSYRLGKQPATRSSARAYSCIHRNPGLCANPRPWRTHSVRLKPRRKRRHIRDERRRLQCDPPDQQREPRWKNMTNPPQQQMIGKYRVISSLASGSQGRRLSRLRPGP